MYIKKNTMLISKTPPKNHSVRVLCTSLLVATVLNTCAPCHVFAEPGEETSFLGTIKAKVNKIPGPGKICAALGWAAAGLSLAANAGLRWKLHNTQNEAAKAQERFAQQLNLQNISYHAALKLQQEAFDQERNAAEDKMQALKMLSDNDRLALEQQVADAQKLMKDFDEKYAALEDKNADLTQALAEAQQNATLCDDELAEKMAAFERLERNHSEDMKIQAEEREHLARQLDAADRNCDQKLKDEKDFRHGFVQMCINAAQNILETIPGQTHQERASTMYRLFPPKLRTLCAHTAGIAYNNIWENIKNILNQR